MPLTWRWIAWRRFRTRPDDFDAAGARSHKFVRQEFDEFLTARTSLTFVGGYSLLHYFDTALLDYGDATFQGGYNYQMSRKDTIAVSYLFSGFRYSNFNQSINTHTVAVSYGRRVTGRLAFQASAGPQIVFSRMPISGSPETSGCEFVDACLLVRSNSTSVPVTARWIGSIVQSRSEWRLRGASRLIG